MKVVKSDKKANEEDFEDVDINEKADGAKLMKKKKKKEDKKNVMRKGVGYTTG